MLKDFNLFFNSFTISFTWNQWVKVKDSSSHFYDCTNTPWWPLTSKTLFLISAIQIQIESVSWQNAQHVNCSYGIETFRHNYCQWGEILFLTSLFTWIHTSPATDKHDTSWIAWSHLFQPAKLQVILLGPSLFISVGGKAAILYLPFPGLMTEEWITNELDEAGQGGLIEGHSPGRQSHKRCSHWRCPQPIPACTCN